MLLSRDEISPVEVQGLDAPSAFFLVCDHAGRLIPRALGSLGLPPDQLTRHIAWDIGAAAVARRLGTLLNATTFCQRYSRLVIDCNRPLDAVDSIVTESERVPIPGNQALAPGAATERAQEIFHPYHDEISRALDRRRAEGRSTALLTVHSFTPSFLGVRRPWQVGVLHSRDARLALPLLEALRDEGGLVVGHNEPYAAGELTDYSIIQHGERRGLPPVELEIRQDLIADERGQESWAARLARLLPIALQQMTDRPTSG